MRNSPVTAVLSIRVVLLGGETADDLTAEKSKDEIRRPLLDHLTVLEAAMRRVDKLRLDANLAPRPDTPPASA
jgi:hypothetical protein